MSMTNTRFEVMSVLNLVCLFKLTWIKLPKDKKFCEMFVQE